MSASDALALFNITQRPPRTIDRVAQRVAPTNASDGLVDDRLHEYYRSWPGGSGGWSTTRLPGHEEDGRCDVDQYWADEITGDEIFSLYMARNAPVLVRGLLHRWPAVTDFTFDALNASNGNVSVQVSDIPYWEKFGGAGHTEMPLGEYMREAREHRVQGGRHPWYVFRSHPVPTRSDDDPRSLVPLARVPTPAVLQRAFDLAAAAGGGGGVPVGGSAREKGPREVFVNAQFALVSPYSRLCSSTRTINIMML